MVAVIVVGIVVAHWLMRSRSSKRAGDAASGRTAVGRRLGLMAFTIVWHKGRNAHLLPVLMPPVLIPPFRRAVLACRSPLPPKASPAPERLSAPACAPHRLGSPRRAAGAERDSAGSRGKSAGRADPVPAVDGRLGMELARTAPRRATATATAWAEQRRRIDTGEGGKTVLIGSSRVCSTCNCRNGKRHGERRSAALKVRRQCRCWKTRRDPRHRPAGGGRGARTVLTGFAYRGAIAHYKQAIATQRPLAVKRLLEPYFAFYDADFALPTVLMRQDWPQRSSLPKDTRAADGAGGRSRIWRKVEVDQYRALANIWAEHLRPRRHRTWTHRRRRASDGRADRAGQQDGNVARARRAWCSCARPAPVTTTPEQKVLPPVATWDVLLQPGVPGVHFGTTRSCRVTNCRSGRTAYADAKRFTTALAPLVGNSTAGARRNATATHWRQQAPATWGACMADRRPRFA